MIGGSSEAIDHRECVNKLTAVYISLSSVSLKIFTDYANHYI
jgi:hypothetical protein